jgi:methionyl-tRNA formyltransferase
MDKKDLKILFYGTPDFAVGSLEALVNAGFNIIGVVTAPDKPQGRGRQLAGSAVKQYAEAKGIPVLQPTNLKSAEFSAQLKEFNPDLQIIVAFRMLPESVWAYPRLGTFNLHASLLPAYRGAAPINWAIINGEAKTGVTTFFLQHEIDTGNILFQQEVEITDDDNAGSLHDKLREIGSKLVVKTVEAIATEQVNPLPQSEEGLHLKAPKLFKEHGKIDWNQPGKNIKNLVRGLSPYPAAWAVMDGKNLKIFEVKTEVGIPLLSPGSIMTDYKTFFKIACSDGWVYLTDIQLEGKKRMGVKEFLLGNKPSADMMG